MTTFSILPPSYTSLFVVFSFWDHTVLLLAIVCYAICHCYRPVVVVVRVIGACGFKDYVYLAPQ